MRSKIRKRTIRKSALKASKKGSPVPRRKVRRGYEAMIHQAILTDE